MAISSINISKGKRFYMLHNDRTQKTKNDIFPEEENYYSCSSYDALNELDRLTKERKKIYTKRTGQKVQAKTITHLSAIVNLNKEHTEKDLDNLCKYLEDSLDTKIVQYVIHRTEGHIDKDGNKKINYHAHIEFLGLDSDGKSIRQKLTKQYLRDLQTKTAEILQMERGAKGSKKKRLGTNEYKQVAEEKAKQEEIIKMTQKELKELIKQQREILKENNAKREDYAILEQEHKELKQKLKNKQLTDTDIDNLKKKIIQQTKRIIQTGKPKLFDANKIIFDKVNLQNNIYKSLKHFSTVLSPETEKVYKDTINAKNKEIDLLNTKLEANKKLKPVIEKLEKDIIEYKTEKDKEINKLNEIIKNKEKEIQELKKSNKELLKVIKDNKPKTTNKEYGRDL